MNDFLNSMPEKCIPDVAVTCGLSDIYCNTLVLLQEYYFQ